MSSITESGRDKLSKVVVNKKINSKKYIESLYNDSEDEDLVDSSNEILSPLSITSTPQLNVYKKGHLRNDSSSSYSSYKKKEGVSNSIKALQDKIKKDLDLNDIEGSPGSYRSNSIKSPNFRAPPSPTVENPPVTIKKVVATPPVSGLGIANADEPPAVVAIKREVPAPKPIASPLDDIFTELLTSTSPTTTGGEQHYVPKKKNCNIPQFKVVKKTPLLTPDSPGLPGSPQFGNEEHRQELKQFQLIDREISKKIKKIKAEVKFIEDSLPPNPCIHDFQSRKKLALAKLQLEKSLEFWDKKKYENGINFSKLSRKVIYSGGEDVTTFFSGRIE